MGVSKLQRYCTDCEQHVLGEKNSPNHVLHLLLTLVTVGFWGFIWVFTMVVDAFTPYRCPQCGGNTSVWARPPKLRKLR